MNLRELSIADLKNLPSGAEESRGRALDLFRKLESGRAASEAWKYTNLRALTDVSVSIQPPVGHLVENDALQKLSSAILFVADGSFKTAAAIPGVHFQKAPQFEFLSDDIVRWSKASESFPFLSWATAPAYLSLKIDANTNVQGPVLIEHNQGLVEKGDGSLASSVLKFVNGRGSKTTVVQRFSSTPNTPQTALRNSITNSVSHIEVAEGSELEWIIVQDESSSQTHLNHLRISLASGSRARVILLNLGGSLSRTQLTCLVNGAEAFADLMGFTLGSGDQHHDVNVVVEHTQPDGRSRQVFKGIYSDKARGVFSGMIHIHKDAQRTDSRQLSKNILIGRKSRVDTRPQLEILADDVKANHGATIGRINEEEVFYLESRGISRQEAVALVANGFGVDILSAIRDENLRNFVVDLLNARMPQVLHGLGTGAGGAT